MRRTKTLLIALTHSAYDSAESAAAIKLQIIDFNLMIFPNLSQYLLKVCDIDIMIELQGEGELSLRDSRINRNDCIAVIIVEIEKKCFA